jgi:hypothetical protein
MRPHLVTPAAAPHRLCSSNPVRTQTANTATLTAASPHTAPAQAAATAPYYRPPPHNAAQDGKAIQRRSKKPSEGEPGG